jgi:hypothetical protein
MRRATRSAWCLKLRCSQNGTINRPGRLFSETDRKVIKVFR